MNVVDIAQTDKEQVWRELRRLAFMQDVVDVTLPEELPPEARQDIVARLRNEGFHVYVQDHGWQPAVQGALQRRITRALLIRKHPR